MYPFALRDTCKFMQSIYNSQHMKTLAAKKRDTATSLDTLRAEGGVPGIVYGSGIENITVSVQENEVRKIWRDVKDTGVFTLDIEGETKNVIMKDMQVHVVNGSILHIDFQVQTA